MSLVYLLRGSVSYLTSEVFAVAVPEGALAAFDVLVPLAVPFDDPVEPDTAAELEVDGLEVAVAGVFVVDFGAVGFPDVSWIGPPVRVVLLARSFFHRVRLR